MSDQFPGKDLFNYKLRFVTCALLFGYCLLHVKLTGAYVETTLDQWYTFSVRLPFGQRFLMPALAHLLAYWFPLKVSSLFFIIELLLVILFYFALKKLLHYAFSDRQSQYLSWLFILLLPLVTIVNYRFTSGGKAPFFYPYDSASLFFIAIGYLLCLQKRWICLALWIFLATFNRESSLLLVFIIPALHSQRLKKVIKPMLFSFAAYCLARVIILLFVHPLPGDVLDFYSRGETHFLSNLTWLFSDQHLFLFIFCFAAMPLFWFAFYDYIPLQYRPLRYLVFFYFCGLLVVGIFMEARIFSEIVLLLYLPVCIAMSRWLAGMEAFEIKTGGVLYYIDRYFIVGILVFIVLFRNQINQLLLFLLSRLN